MNQKIPYDEQETVIVIPSKKIGSVSEVYTCVPAMMKKLAELAKSRPDCVRIKRDLGDAMFADVDSGCIRLIPKRILSEDRKRILTEQIAKARRGTK